MKVLTIVGTRPELIRLSVIIKKLDDTVKHVLVYTNQNYDYNLSTRFFEELKIRKPDYYFAEPSTKSFAHFFGNAIIEMEKILFAEQPDKILVLGDTNSGLLSIMAKRMQIPIYHMEAGNRCYDERLPEEANRRIIDTISTYNLPYTEGSKQNLLREGYHKNSVFKTGNPIFEVLMEYDKEIISSNVCETHNLKGFSEFTDYVLVTLHRSENVDDAETLGRIVKAINQISKKHLVIVSKHPHTQNNMKGFGLLFSSEVLQNNFGFFDFVHLERNAKCVITDSGTVPEECCIFGVPTLTIRDATERQELLECGSNILVGTDTKSIVGTFNATIDRKYKWNVPEDYMNPNVSDTVINFLIGK